MAPAPSVREVVDRIVEAFNRWVCRHDFTGDKGRGIPLLKRWGYRLAFGPRAGWYGADAFHFDGDGKIAAKHSHANAKTPQVRRDRARPG